MVVLTSGARGEAFLTQSLGSSSLVPNLFHHQMSLQIDSLNLSSSSLYIRVACASSFFWGGKLVLTAVPPQLKGASKLLGITHLHMSDPA